MSEKAGTAAVMFRDVSTEKKHHVTVKEAERTLQDQTAKHIRTHSTPLRRLRPLLLLRCPRP